MEEAGMSELSQIRVQADMLSDIYNAASTSPPVIAAFAARVSSALGAILDEDAKSDSWVVECTVRDGEHHFTFTKPTIEAALKGDGDE